MTAAIAPETDRLVWAVTNRVRAGHANGKVAVMQEMPGPAFGMFLTIAPFLDAGVDEDWVRRRYIYAPADDVSALLRFLVDRGYVTRSVDRLNVTTAFGPVLEGIESAIREAAHFHWGEQPHLVDVALVPARQVLEASTEPDVLVTAALALPEADDKCQRLYERLAALRLLRNEAHVRAWRSHNLYPGEVEMLTAAWKESKLQAPPEPSELLVEQGLVADGAVTDKGVALRRQIEAETNAAVEHAFSLIDRDEFLDILRSLPGAP